MSNAYIIRDNNVNNVSCRSFKNDGAGRSIGDRSPWRGPSPFRALGLGQSPFFSQQQKVF